LDAGTFLLHLALLFVVARVAAEAAERVKVPAVLAEIAAGIVLGPSLFNVVPKGESLHFLGELGAIFLLMEVGLHMDLRELLGVGRSAMQVAWIGVIVPFAAGFVAMRALGLTAPVALFLAAGITATSVGITARVFADMRMLASNEAQTVLGAAVADDVIGLMILTVVTRVATGGSVSVTSIAAVTAVGLLFVGGATGVGSWLAPILFGRFIGKSRIEGTLVAAAVAFTLAFAGLASAARLAPIVGAFVAGVALGRTPQRDELRRRMAPVGHLFVPVFFLLIGAEAHIQSLASGRILAIAGVLGAIAVAGKVASGLGAPRRRADRLLIGLGMIPRGEVGLVFATLGLSSGALDASEHATLLLVVLVTTIIAPPLLRVRIERGRRAARERAATEMPRDGWLAVEGGEVELVGDPAPSLAPVIGLEAARMCSSVRPGRHLLDWLQASADDDVVWDQSLRRLFFDLLRESDARSWRFLEVTGLLQHLLPLDATTRRQKRDPFDLDPIAALHWEEVEALRRLTMDERTRADVLWSDLDQDVVYLAAFVRSAFDDGAGNAARTIAQTMGLDPEQEELVVFLSEERALLPAIATRMTLGNEERVLELAVHIGDRKRSDALYLLALAGEEDPTVREALTELHTLVNAALADAAVTGSDTSGIVEQRKAEALRLLPPTVGADVRRLVDAAPRRYLLAHTPAEIARHLPLFEPPLTRNEVRLRAEPDLPRQEWTLFIATLDRPGALAALTGAFAKRGVPILEASISSWPNGFVVDVFRVAAPPDADWDALREEASTALKHTNGNGKTREPIEGRLTFDNVASPWHTIVEIRAHDRAGLLARVAEVFSRSRAQIHHATVETVDGVAVDSFLVSGPDGHKLSDRDMDTIRRAFEGKNGGRWGRRSQRKEAAASTS
jgi:Kef-type K+ transport system membrane component KefB/predicted amino acid-binding ACT domain protein